MQVVLSAMNCSNTGVSESFVAYNWLSQISKRNDVDIITSEDNPEYLPNVVPHHISTDHWLLRSIPDGFRSAVKPDYFLFDRRATRQLRTLAANADIFHHLAPIAPRYSSGLGRAAKRFVLGPIGGGLRVPQLFRKSVESGEPVFARLRQLDALRFRIDPALRATYNAADIILVIAPYMLDVIPERYHSKIRFMTETGIDACEYERESAVRPTRKVVQILYVGRVTPYKGLEFLIRALAKLPDSLKLRTQTQIVGAGESTYERHCRQLAADLGLEHRIIFHGRLSKSEVRIFYRQSDIFCFPTLAETSGNVIVEAMAMGLPLISTNFGGPTAFVHENCGFLAEPESPDSFATQISSLLAQLIENPDLRQSIGGNARKHILENFSWDRKGIEMQQIYESLLP